MRSRIRSPLARRDGAGRRRRPAVDERDAAPPRRPAVGSGAAKAPQPSLHDLPLLIADVRATGLEVDFAQSGDLDPLEPTLQATLYRSVQEGLTNVMKHASGVTRHDRAHHQSGAQGRVLGARRRPASPLLRRGRRRPARQRAHRYGRAGRDLRRHGEHLARRLGLDRLRCAEGGDRPRWCRC